MKQLQQYYSVPIASFPARVYAAGPFSHVLPDDRKPFHTSALQAVAVDTFSLAYRLRLSSSPGGAMGAVDMGSLTRLLARSPACRAASLALGFPVTDIRGQHLQATTVSSFFARKR